VTYCVPLPRGFVFSDTELKLLSLSVDVNDAEDNATLVDCPTVRIPDVITAPTTTRTTLPPTAPPGHTGATGPQVYMVSRTVLSTCYLKLQTKTGVVTPYKMSDIRRPKARP